MRVDFFASTATQEVPRVPNKEDAAHAWSTVGKVSGSPVDRTTLISGSNVAAWLTEQAMHSGAVRAERIEALRQAVSSGQYKPNPATIADALVSASN